MSIMTIFTVLKFVKKNWGAFLVIALASALFISTFYFRFYITRINNRIEDLIEKNEQLEAENKLFQDELEQKQTTIEMLNIYSNSYAKLKNSTNFYIPRETAKVILDINFDFYSNRQRLEGKTGLDITLEDITNKGDTGFDITNNKIIATNESVEANIITNGGGTE